MLCYHPNTNTTLLEIFGEPFIDIMGFLERVLWPLLANTLQFGSSLEALRCGPFGLRGMILPSTIIVDGMLVRWSKQFYKVFLIMLELLGKKALKDSKRGGHLWWCPCQVNTTWGSNNLLYCMLSSKSCGLIMHMMLI